jgi:hypothetical protein
MKEKTQAEMENEKIRDMLDNYDSLSPTDKNFLGRLILSRFSREENMSRFFKLNVTGVFDPDDLVLSHVKFVYFFVIKFKILILVV